MDGLLTQKQVAAFLKVERRTLWRWRKVGYGPPSLRVSAGNAIRYRYRKEDLLAWIESQRVKPEQLKSGTIGTPQVELTN